MPEEIAEAAPAEEPAPQEAPQFQIPAAQPGEEPTAQEVAQYQNAQQYLQQSAQTILKEMETAPAPTTERERFRRNMNWIVVLKDGNAQQRAEVRNQIREAGLSRDEAMELEQLFRMYNVRP
ncbi:MAG TPA: hypothetical protein VMS21_12920 [Methylomirabilota bacterium]|nr:hypothetical protein [Methylomirabilota bacterium]